MKANNLQLLRNETICNSREEALEKINSIITLSIIKDGIPFICRYKDNEQELQTMLVFVYKTNDNQINSNIFDTGIIKKLEKEISLLREKY